MDKIVIDTNVFISALMSNQGASFKLLSLVGTGLFDFSLSVALVLEYEDAAKRLSGTKIKLNEQAIDDVLDYFCLVGQHDVIYYLWRPTLPDPRDDMVLELAVNAHCPFIVTHNLRDFRGVQKFGVRAVTPQEFLRIAGVIP